MQQDPHYKFDFFRRTKELKLYQILMPALVLTFCMSGVLGFVATQSPHSTGSAQDAIVHTRLETKELISGLLNSPVENTSLKQLMALYNAVPSTVTPTHIAGTIPDTNVSFDLSAGINSVTLTGLTKSQVKEIKSLFAYKDTDYIIYQVYRYKTVENNNKTDLTISLKYIR